MAQLACRRSMKLPPIWWRPIHIADTGGADAVDGSVCRYWPAAAFGNLNFDIWPISQESFVAARMRLSLVFFSVGYYSLEAWRGFRLIHSHNLNYTVAQLWRYSPK